MLKNKRVDKMKKREIGMIIIALTKLIEITTKNIEIELEINQLRLEDWKKCNHDGDIEVSRTEETSWPDDFEEDWE